VAELGKKTRLAHEDHYNGAIIEQLKHLGFEVTNPCSTSTGKVDVFVRRGSTEQTCAIEGIMASRTTDDHEEHLRRFLKSKGYGSYHGAVGKCLVTIGTRNLVVDRLAFLANTAAGDDELEKVVLVGLVPSAAHDAYTMIVSHGTEPQEEHVFACDGVSKVSQADDSKGATVFVSAQEWDRMEGERCSVVVFSHSLPCIYMFAHLELSVPPHSNLPLTSPITHHPPPITHHPSPIIAYHPPHTHHSPYLSPPESI
jgi:hypothetical protein